MANLVFRGSKKYAKNIISSVVKMLTGKEPDRGGLARGVHLAIGTQALSLIHEDFVVKSRGGTGKIGGKWQKLTRAYLAYQRRFGKGEQSALKKAAGAERGASHGVGGNRGLLTKSQVELWNRTFADRFARFQMSMPDAAAKARAAAVAWIVVKKAGGKTMIDVYGGREVEILKDTGILLNSLSAGEIRGGVHRKPKVKGGADQIVENLKNGVIVGTNVKYAAAHNYGVPGRLPRRQFLPDGDLPDEWNGHMEDVLERAITELAEQLISRGSK